MNLFASSPDPVDCARALDDSRVVKMVLESAQLLSAVSFDLQDFGAAGLYRPTHLRHPVTLWAMADRVNTHWVGRHARALAEEYSYRYGRIHASEAVIDHAGRLLHDAGLVAEGQPCDFANCAANRALGLDFRHLPVHEAYRRYLSARWLKAARAPRWTGREPPPWR